MHIVIDSSIIRKMGWRSAKLRRIFDFCRAGYLKVYLPEIVAEECRSADFSRIQEQVSAASTALSRLIYNPLVNEDEKKALEGALSVLSEDEITTRHRAEFEQRLNEDHISLYKMTVEQAKLAWERYFSGKEPFSKTKERQDIPDGFIYAAIIEMKQRTPDLIALIEDKRLSRSVALAGVTVHQSLDEFFESQVFKDFEIEVDIQQKWEKGYPEIVAHKGDLIKEVTAYIRSDGESILVGEKASLGRDQETDAQVYAVYGITNIKVDEFEEVAPGAIQCAVTFYTDLGLWLTVDRPWKVPATFSINEYDEHTSYVDAEGDFTLPVTVRLELSVDLEGNPNFDGRYVSGVSVAEGPYISIAEEELEAPHFPDE